MILKFNYILVFFIVSVLLFFSMVSIACTCIGKDKQTTASELNSMDLAVQGKIISVRDFDYYDTAVYSLRDFDFKLGKSGALIRKYKLYTFIIDTKFKITKNISDTIQIVTGYGGGDCGYEFKIGKDYIVYGETWKEKVVTVKHKKRKDKKKIIETIVANKFYTDICSLTQYANDEELERLRRLTE